MINDLKNKIRLLKNSNFEMLEKIRIEHLRMLANKQRAFVQPDEK